MESQLDSVWTVSYTHLDVYKRQDLLKAGAIKPGDEVNFCVPTGNFGDILAADYAGKAGLPVGRLICASNENNVLTDFINTGVYLSLIHI